MDSRQEHLIYAFGDFQLDARRRVLSSGLDGKPLPITGKIFDTLLYFAERAGQLLDKRTLMEALWPNMVVEESNLTQTIHTLRRVLGERPEEHRFIVTVPGRGYRFVADVRVETVAEPEQGAAEKAVQADSTPAHGRKRLLVAALSMAVIGALLLLFLGRHGETRRMPMGVGTHSIAVLPFVDMSPEQNQEYFADGLSEEILNLLAHSASLRVIARTSSFSFRNESNDIATIAKRLNVTHILEGSVRKSGERIRITAQLVDGATSEHLWSETYDREVKDVLGVQSDIAAAVAESLQVTLTGTDPPRRRETNSTEAFERYLAGRHFLNRRGVDDVAKAADYFKEALQIDPGYARAWAGLAGTYHAMLTGTNPMPESTLRQWREAVDQSLARGPNLAESHVRAAQYYWDLGDTDTAERHCKRAIVLNPSDAMVLSVSAGKAILAGRLSDAVSLQRSAVAVDPLSAANRANLGVYLTAVGQLDDAKAELEKAGELSPTLFDVHADIARVLVIQQRPGEALAAAEKLPEGQLRDHSLALVYQALGDKAAADTTWVRLLALAADPASDMLAKVAVAEVSAFRDDPDEAFKWLVLAARQTREDRGRLQELYMTQQVNVSPFFDRLHSDPRWQSVLASIDVIHSRE